MAFRSEVLEKFAMQAEQLSREAKTFGASISVSEIAEKAGIPGEDAWGIARYLMDLGWANVEFRGNTPLTLTPLGYQEIAKLRRPKWRRWIDAHPVALGFLLSVVAGVISGLVVFMLSILVHLPK